MSNQNRAPKTDSLRRHSSLNPHPENARDELFRSHPFFDPRDIVQVKYEMLRSVRRDGRSVSESAARFGLSRPTWYQAQRAYDAGGLAALAPGKPGSQARCGGHRGLAHGQGRAARNPVPAAGGVGTREVRAVRASSERRARPGAGKRMTNPGSARPTLRRRVARTATKRLRRQAIQPAARTDRCGLAVLVRQGVAAWLRSLAELPPAPAVMCAAPVPVPQDEAMIDILLAIARRYLREAEACSPTTVR